MPTVTPRKWEAFAFPNLNDLDVLPVVKPREPYAYHRKRAEFSNRLIAFYAHVQTQAGALHTPYVGGVCVNAQMDRELFEWCIRAIYKRLPPEKQIAREFGMTWMSLGPSVRDGIPDGEIHLEVETAYPNGLESPPSPTR